VVAKKGYFNHQKYANKKIQKKFGYFENFEKDNLMKNPI